MKYLLTVLWQPQIVFERLRDGARIGSVVISVILINFVLTLLMVKFFTETVSQRFAAAGLEASPGLMHGLTTISLVTGSLTNVLLLSLVALLLTLVVLAVGGEGSFRKMLGVLLIGSAPSQVAALLRVSFYKLGLTVSPQVSLTTIGAALPFLHGSLLSIAKAIDFFDIWSFGLVVYGFSLVSGLPRKWAYLVGSLVWGGLQFVLIRTIVSGGTA